MDHKIEKSLLGAYFIGINLLFVLKYGIRLDGIPISVLLIAYFLFGFLLLLKNPFDYNWLKPLVNRYFYWTLVAIFSILFILIVSLTDGNALNVDRWSAMDVAIRAVFEGNYPYTAIDHLDGRTSNFPGLILLGMPFYLLGNVGYLQVFAFALLAFTLYRCLPLKRALYYLVLLLSAPAFWWEIVALSDLMSNVIIVLCATMLWKEYFQEAIYDKPIFLAIIITVLIFTRGIVFIPLMLFIFAPFWKAKLREKIEFIVTSLLLSAFMLLLVLQNVPDKETLMQFNPLLLQTRYTPWFINMLGILLPLFVSFKIKQFNSQYFLYSVVLMSGMILFSAFDYVSPSSFNAWLFDNGYDISYLSLVFPYLLYLYVYHDTRGGDTMQI